LQQAFSKQYDFCSQVQTLYLLFLAYPRDSTFWAILKAALPWTTKTERWISFVVHEQVGTQLGAAQSRGERVKFCVLQTVQSQPSSWE
jgi:hypothetical protein